jgi:hypothetical protein
VLAHYGIDSAEYSFGYCAHWSDAKTIRESAGVILEASGEVLDRLEQLEAGQLEPASTVTETIVEPAELSQAA